MWPDEGEFLDLVDFGSVTFSLESIICTSAEIRLQCMQSLSIAPADVNLKSMSIARLYMYHVCVCIYISTDKAAVYLDCTWVSYICITSAD